MKSQFIRAILLFMIITDAFAVGQTKNIYEPWDEYADRIPNCMMDQFILPEPNYADLTVDEKKDLRISQQLQEYKIYGWDNGKCVISNKDYAAPGTITTGSQFCTFSKEDLSTISAFARDVAKDGQSKTYMHPYVELLKKNCELVY
jgi:hypothetical protein